MKLSLIIPVWDLCLVDWISPSTQGNRMKNFAVNPEPKNCSFTGDSSKDVKGELQSRGLLCSEAPQEATEKDPCPPETGGTPAR